MHFYTEKIANVSWGREGDAAHFMCTTPDCDNQESVPDFEHGQSPRHFLFIPGVKGNEAKCYRCGKGGKNELETIHQ